jgi:hypothetical protein
MKLTKTVAVPLVGALLLIGTGAVVASTSAQPNGTSNTVPVAAPTQAPLPTAGTTVKPVKEDTALTDALDSLVTKGTITAEQKTAVLDAVAAERAARRTERQANRAQMQELWADGVITKEEFDKLPADSPLRTMTGLMDDGKITADELRGLRKMVGGGRGHGMWGGKGQGNDNGNGPVATPAPSAATSG